ncbi:DNA adenine methylase [Staphylococcus chromogenes]|uniref:DNA adenine methylase n=1 Tax=Staphylococcus chromogenes TaxID=46126 RepID=UPI000E69C34B|nr:DNA adenine methylase [Staphylococcus chromogenes]RIM15442.1 DNA methyltransferase [Staphylococcus chromogenes]
MNNNFPKINYIGNKSKIADWIINEIPFDSQFTVLDLFSGGSSISFELKKRGFRVIANDALYASYVIAKAIIENKNVKLGLDELDCSTKQNEFKDVDLSWMSEKLYFDYEVDELTKLVSYSYQLEGYRKYIFLTLLRRAMIRKLPYSRMNITWDNIVKLRDEEYSYNKYGRRRAYHNFPFIEHMVNDLNNYNASIFDNGKDNIASNLDAFDALDKYKDEAEIVYIDPPYPGTMNKYQEFYGSFDKMLEKEIYFTDFTNKNDFLNKFEKLIQSISTNYKAAMISLNNNVEPNLSQIIEMLSKYGRLEVKRKKHNYQISGKLNKNSNEEIIAILMF